MMDLRLKEYLINNTVQSTALDSGEKVERIQPNSNIKEIDIETKRLNNELYKENKQLITAMKK